MNYHKRNLLVTACCAAVLILTAATAAGQDIIPLGQDCFTTPSDGSTQFNFGGAGTPIPADFFGPGSDPFDGQVCFQGPGGFPGDTLVDRLADADVTSGSATIDIQLVQLTLLSCQPITVTYNGGQDPEQWDVTVSLVNPQAIGQMTIYKTVPEGGTFDSDLPVDPFFTFTLVGPPGTQWTMPGIPTIMQARGVPWRTEDLPGVTCTPGFSPTLCHVPDTIDPCCVISCHANPDDPLHPHCIIMPDCEPCPPDPDCTPGPGDPIPAVSEWGLVAMVLLVLGAATVAFRRRLAG